MLSARPLRSLCACPRASPSNRKDFDEVTIDYPALPYRAWSERHANLVAYWRLDEAAVSLAVDSKGVTPLTYLGGNNLQYRAFRQETSAVPYGGAPKWTHTSGNGLHATVLPIGIGDDVTIAGFIRQDAGSSGHRYVWQANTTARSLRVSADGSLRARLDGRTLNAPAGTIADNTWHHVAVTRTTSRVRLVVDGVEIVNVVGQTATPIDSLQWSMARADGNEPVNLALDEWGIWSEVLDVAGLYARRTHHRAFGGYVYGVVDATDLGPADQHVF